LRTRHFRRMNLRLLIALAIIAILATAAYGFAAGNTINDGGHAGDGVGTVSGYTVTNVAYTLAANPTKLATVAFHLDAPATTVKVSLDGGTSWTDCDNAAPTYNWSCNISGLGMDVAPVDHLRVVAVQ